MVKKPNIKNFISRSVYTRSIPRFKLNNQPLFQEEVPNPPETQNYSNIFLNENQLNWSQEYSQQFDMPDQPNLVDGQPFYQPPQTPINLDVAYQNFKVNLVEIFQEDQGEMAANHLYLEKYSTVPKQECDVG